MPKIKLYRNLFILILISVSFLFILIHICYAQDYSKARVHAPEPSSLALISTGILGWIVRFARKRFIEFKRFFDVAAGALGILIACPIMAMTAIFIKIVSPGPAFFSQKRVGLGGEAFNMYKLRTMKLDAEQDTGPVWAKKDDHRLIKFGKIIRRLHIDELPQLLNVFKGEMSIVGPRPERPVFVEKLSAEINEYKKRLSIKPGITGLAQVWHKYDETIKDVKKKIKYDLLYIRKMCFLVDLRILFRTLVVAVTGKGAR